MSSKNEFITGFTKNSSQYIIERYILIDKDLKNEDEQNKFIRQLNEKLWYAIQEVNMRVEGRLLPFVLVRRVRMEGNELRVVINDIESKYGLRNYEETEKLDIKNASHIINVKPINAHRQVMVGDNLVPGNAKMMVDENEMIEAALDIFLDISMFNSFSFLKELPIKDKQNFSNLKFNYYKKNRLTSYYDIDLENPPAYFSFAFYARKDISSIDFDKYIWIWNEFISSYYPDSTNVIPLPEEHIKKFYRESNKLQKRYFEREFWKSYPKGEYLILMINREPNTNEEKKMLGDYFGISPFHVHATKVVPLNSYFNPYINKNLRELYITAFKIIV